jgi:hypothetical protein
MSGQQHSGRFDQFIPLQHVKQQHLGGTLVAAQIRKNGQIKYHRTRFEPEQGLVEMPDGELVAHTGDRRG